MKAEYKVVLRLSAQKELRTIQKNELRRILERLKSLKTQPRPWGIKKLTETGTLRIRQGDWRIVYDINDDTCVVTIIKIGHRREVYR